MSKKASNKTAGKTAEKATNKSGGGVVGWLAALIVIALLATLVPATTLLIVVGILPSLATAFGDNTPDRRATLAIGVPNLAGLVPVLLMLWQGHANGITGNGINAAVAIMLQPMSWLLLYGGAGLGAVIYNLLPKAVAQFAVSRAESGIEARRGYQKMLERSWGPSVRAEEKETKK